MEMAKLTAKIGKYTVVGKIAKGGMGALYLAKHPTLKRHVILKQLTLKGGRGLNERFKREASLMIDFRDEHIVPVYDHFKAGSSYYIVMEYVDGTSLDKLIQNRERLSSEAIILIFLEICKGLKYAHDKEVIHRDIKPANILISKNGEVKLVDFGIATSKQSVDDGLTKTGMTLGTPSYMSPEQIADTSKVDKRADIYSMGVMLYEMATGGKPFPSEFNMETINLINRGIYENPKKRQPSIPHVFRHLIKKTMNHKINRRYKDVQYLINVLSKYSRRYRDQKEINNDIKNYLAGSDTAISTSVKVGKKTKGSSLKYIYILIAFIIIAAGGAYFYLKGYYYEYFRNREYGSLEVKATVQPDFYKDNDLIYAVASLKSTDPREENSEEKEIDNRIYRLTSPRKAFFAPVKKLLFKEKENSEKKNEDIETSSLSTKTLYLPAGNYDLEFYLENQKLYKSFYLNPRAIQRQDIKTYEKRTIQFDLAETDSKRVSFTLKIFDSQTEDSIYKKTDISFYLADEKKWIDWKKYNNSKKLKRYLSSILLSGRNYSFKFNAPGYYPKRVKFHVEKNLDSALIEVGLIKEPGKLVIKSDYEGLVLLIDNRKENYTGGLKKDFVRYGKTTEGVSEYVLSEGKYILTVEKDKKNVKNLQFSISPNKTTSVDVSYNREEKELRILKK
jgi:serine/threonine-protein kinase